MLMSQAWVMGAREARVTGGFPLGSPCCLPLCAVQSQHAWQRLARVRHAVSTQLGVLPSWPHAGP